MAEAPTPRSFGAIPQPTNSDPRNKTRYSHHFLSPRAIPLSIRHTNVRADRRSRCEAEPPREAPGRPCRRLTAAIQSSLARASLVPTPISLHSQTIRRLANITAYFLGGWRKLTPAAYAPGRYSQYHFCVIRWNPTLILGRWTNFTRWRYRPGPFNGPRACRPASLVGMEGVSAGWYPRDESQSRAGPPSDPRATLLAATEGSECAPRLRLSWEPPFSSSHLSFFWPGASRSFASLACVTAFLPFCHSIERLSRVYEPTLGCRREIENWSE